MFSDDATKLALVISSLHDRFLCWAIRIDNRLREREQKRERVPRGVGWERSRARHCSHLSFLRFGPHIASACQQFSGADVAGSYEAHTSGALKKV